MNVYTNRKVLADFDACDWWRYCKALCDLKFSRIEGNGRKFLEDVVPECWLHGEADDWHEDVPALTNQHEHWPGDVPDIHT